MSSFVMHVFTSADSCILYMNCWPGVNQCTEEIPEWKKVFSFCSIDNGFKLSLLEIKGM